MRAFRFHLQPVLKVRALEERQSFLELQEALSALRKAEKHLENLHHQNRQVEREIRSQLTDALSLMQVVSLQQCLSVLRKSLASQRQLVQKLSELHQQHVDAYLECRRKREILERLREKAWHLFLYEVDRAEQLEADELAMRLHESEGASRGLAGVWETGQVSGAPERSL